MSSEEALKLLNDIQEKISHFDLKQTKRDVMEVKEYVKEQEETNLNLKKKIIKYEQALKIYQRVVKLKSRLVVHSKIYWLTTFDNPNDISKEEHELLKELEEDA